MVSSQSLYRLRRSLTGTVILAVVGSLLVHILAVAALLFDPALLFGTAWKPSNGADTPSTMRVDFIEVRLSNLVGSRQKYGQTRIAGSMANSVVPSAAATNSNEPAAGKLRLVNPRLHFLHALVSSKAGSQSLSHAAVDASYKSSISNEGRVVSTVSTKPLVFGESTQNKLPSFIQLMPTGDTAIMSHKIKGVSYRATRFEQYWTPEGESSIDTILRKIKDKITVEHTFNIAPGIRIKCVLTPVLPFYVLSCGNGYPPPLPLPQKVYKPLYLPSPLSGTASNPSGTSSVAPSTSSPVPESLDLGNSAICSTARVTGGPPPRGCLPVAPVARALSTSGSWIPSTGVK